MVITQTNSLQKVLLNLSQMCVNKKSQNCQKDPYNLQTLRGFVVGCSTLLKNGKPVSKLGHQLLTPQHQYVDSPYCSLYIS